jgi:hypothetical protein
MELKLAKQKAIYKNLMKMGAHRVGLQIFQLRNFQTKTKLQKIEKHKQHYFCLPLS